MHSEWPASRWQLSAPESFVLLNGPGASAREAFKLAVMELVGRGVFVLENDRRKKPIVHDGPKAHAPRERSLMAIWDVYRSGRSPMRLDELGRKTVKQYGSLNNYVKQEVVVALELDRGFYERREARILWIFPTVRFELTPRGQEAKAELEAWLDVGRQRFATWSSNEPSQALAYAGMAGAALLLMPMLYGDLRGLHERARDSGWTSDASGGIATIPSGDDGDRELDFDGAFDSFDFGNLDFGSVDFGSSDFGGGFSDGGSGGDGGGGGGDGGGGES